MFKTAKKQHRLLYAIVTGAAIITFWRGLWGLLDLYFFPGNEPLSYMLSVLIGLAILYLNDYSLEEIE